MINNYELRYHAHKALRPHRSVMLVIALIATLPSLLAQTVTLLTESDLQSHVLTLAMDPQSVVYTGTMEQVLAELTAFIQSQGWISLVMSLASAVIAPVLQLGLIFATLTLLRKGEPHVKMSLARMDSFLRSVALMLLFFVKLLAWCLPGLAVMILGEVLAIVTGAAAFLYLLLAGMIVMLVMLVRASYSYAMCTIFLADQPTLTARECIRRSKEVMQGQRMQLFWLELTYVGWNILAVMVGSMLGPVIGSTLSMALQLIVMVYMNTARCAFYEAHRTRLSV